MANTVLIMGFALGAAFGLFAGLDDFMGLATKVKNMSPSFMKKDGIVDASLLVIFGLIGLMSAYVYKRLTGGGAGAFFADTIGSKYGDILPADYYHGVSVPIDFPNA